MFFNQSDDISTQNGGSLKLMDKFTYLGSTRVSLGAPFIRPCATSKQRAL